MLRGFLRCAIGSYGTDPDSGHTYLVTECRTAPPGLPAAFPPFCGDHLATQVTKWRPGGAKRYDTAKRRKCLQYAILQDVEKR